MTSAPRPFTTPGGSASGRSPSSRRRRRSREQATRARLRTTAHLEGASRRPSRRPPRRSLRARSNRPSPRRARHHRRRINPLRERSGAAGKDIVSPSQSLRDGAPMRGVSSFPYDPQQSQYIDDFARSSPPASPTLTRASPSTNADSISFNVITGTAYSTPGVQSSEYKRSFNGASLRKPFGAPGLRSEEMITVGQCPVVGRSV